MHVVVDTNVPKVASGHAEHADQECVDTCIQALARIMNSGILLLDDSGKILEQYINSLGLAGRPGAGEKFVKWAFDNQWVPGRCLRVIITPMTSASGRKYSELPELEWISRFDRDEHKFVAVSLACSHKNEILNAVDSDWARFAKELSGIGIRVRELCRHPVRTPRRRR